MAFVDKETLVNLEIVRVAESKGQVNHSIAIYTRYNRPKLFRLIYNQGIWITSSLVYTVRFYIIGQEIRHTYHD